MRWLNVEVPDPEAPAPGDVIDKGDQVGDAISGMSPEAMTLVAIAIIALVAMALLKRPFVRGLVIGGILLAVVVAAMKGGGG